jgi:F-type H+-transporting ATPase subunit gamma
VRSTRDIRSKIRTVRSIEQICRAMKTVSSIRLRRAEQRLQGFRPYRAHLAGLVATVAEITQEHPFLQPRPVRKTGLLLITSDRGLCGGYNALAVRRALAVGPPDQVLVLAAGRRGLMHLRRSYEIAAELAPLGGEPDFAAVRAFAEQAGRLYLEGRIDRLLVVYSRFLAGTRSELRADEVLPVRPGESQVTDILFDPSPAEMLPGLMRRHLETEILGAVLESSASEHAARVAAMTAASDNAEELIQQLTLAYNKARQAGITGELIEIVSAAEAAA